MNCLRVVYGVKDVKNVKGENVTQLKMIYNGVDYSFWDPEKVLREQVSSLKNKH